MWNSQPSKDKTKIYPSDNSYKCSSYKQYTKDCTMHYISSPVVENLIFSAIKRICYFTANHEKELVALVEKSTSTMQKEKLKEQKANLKTAKERYKELDTLVKKLYEMFAKDSIPEKHFNKLLSDYDTEQTEIENIIKILHTSIEQDKSKQADTKDFIELVGRYTDFTELTTPMLNEFIEKVCVHEAEKIAGVRNQRVDIHFNFVGNISLPADFATPEELEEQSKAIEEQAKKELRSKELSKIRGDKQGQKRKEIVARKHAGLLTAEELEEEEKYLEHRRLYYRERRKTLKENAEKVAIENEEKQSQSSDLLSAS